eukprot:2140156-Pyramimonas_sp.AAC.1
MKRETKSGARAYALRQRGTEGRNGHVHTPRGPRATRSPPPAAAPAPLTGWDARETAGPAPKSPDARERAS